MTTCNVCGKEEGLLEEGKKLKCWVCGNITTYKKLKQNNSQKGMSDG